MIPVILMMGFVPLLVHMYSYNSNLSQFEWFPANSDTQTDFFFAWKMIAIVIIGVVMVAILLYRHYVKKETLQFENSFYFLLVYGLFVLMSALFSKHKHWVSGGTYELFESVWVVFAYMLLCYYVYNFVNEEKHVEFILKISGIGMAIVTVIGVFQYFGLDFFQSNFGKHLITNPGWWKNLKELTFNFPSKTSYTTLYNPNFLSFYFGMLIVLAVCLFIASKKIWHRIVLAVAVVCCAICLKGSGSASGWMALALAAVVLILVLLSRKKKLFVVGAVVVVIGIIAAIVLGNTTSAGENIKNTIVGTYRMSDRWALNGVETNTDDVVLDIHGNKLSVSYTVGEDGTTQISCKDSDGNELSQTIVDADNQVATMDDGMKFAGNTGLAIKKLNSTMTIRGTGTKADTEYDPSNIKTMVDADGNMIVGLDKNLKADSVGINGKDGRDGATIKGGDGKPGVDGTNITRLIIEEKNGKQHDIATLDDGMKYGGDTGAVIKKKLNGQVNVVGGIKDESKLTTDDNIGVVSDGSNNLKVRLAKDVKLNSVTAGNVVMDTTGFYVKKMTRTPAGTVSLTADGLNNGGNKIANIAAGEADTDAVNVSQLKKAAASATTKVADGKNTTVTSETNADGSKTYHVNLNDDITLGTDPSKQISIKGTEGTIKAGQVTVNGTAGTVNGLTNKTWDPNHITSGQAATEDQLKVVSGQAGKHSSVTAGSNISVTTGTNANGGTDYKVSVVDTPTFKTVTTGNTVMSNSGLTIKNGPSITQTGVDAGGKRITNVAAGKADTDAVNVGQLKQIGGAINKVDNRINRVGAGAAALAALHPLDFDPDDKWDFTLGYGNYKDAHSLALGAFYRPNEDTMISVGGSLGGGENMVNAGLSMKLGQGNHVSTSKVAMAKEIKDLRAELENVKGALLKVADGRPLDSMDMDKMQLFPDVPENHWAYDYVATLAGNGVIVGYPDGQFGGDRMMTRYEMAALIYRAMQNGAAADDRMARALKEFEPELERIRVDTISKHKDGTPDIQRVRVIKGRG